MASTPASSGAGLCPTKIDAPPIQRCAPGAEISIAVFFSHFARKQRRDVTLRWRFGGIDSLGQVHDGVAAGSEAIDFPHWRLAPAKLLLLRMPQQTMLGTLWVLPTTPDGSLVAANYVQVFVDGGAPAWQRMNRRTVYRLDAHSWSSAEWNAGGMFAREEAQAAGAVFLSGSFPSA